MALCLVGFLVVMRSWSRVDVWVIGEMQLKAFIFKLDVILGYFQLELVSWDFIWFS